MRRKKIILMSLIAFIGIIILLSMIYQLTSLWEPEQSLITLLPENPVGYLSFKELEGFVETFNRSELGKQGAEMPFLADIKEQFWWKRLVYQKELWEYEMGGKLEQHTFKAYFGEETIFALYQRDEKLTFLLMSAMGTLEKLAVEAMTATDAINPKYRRIQTEHEGFVVNTITGYPRDFSYTFIGRIGILSLSYPLLTEVLDVYTGKKWGCLKNHPMQEYIQKNYIRGKSTGYVDVQRLAKFASDTPAGARNFVEQIHPLLGKTEFWTFSNRYEDGVIFSNHRFLNTSKASPNLKAVPQLRGRTGDILTARTAFVTTIPRSHQIATFFPHIDLSQCLGTELTIGLIAPKPDELSIVPSVILLTPVKAPDKLKAELENLKTKKISIANKPLEFPPPEDYQGVVLHPFQLRLNFLLTLTGGYAIINEHIVFSTTLAGLKSMIDTSLGQVPALTNVMSNKKASSVQTFIQPHLFVPELKRFLPMITRLTPLFGQNLEAKWIRQIQENLFPLEALGPVSTEVQVGENDVDVALRIVLKE